MEGCDAAHVHGLTYPACLLAVLQARRRRLPTVITEHVGSIRFKNPILRVVQMLALRCGVIVAARSGSAVVVLNDRVAHEISRLCNRIRIIKVPNGVDCELFAPTEPSHREALRERFGLSGPTVLGVGRNVPKKGFRQVLAAAAGIADVMLVGAGTGSLSGPGCRSIEAMSQAELADLYRAVDLLALPSEGEGVPLVVQEALASGLLVVMGDDPAVRAELPEEPIRFVPASSIPALRAAMIDLLERPNQDGLRVVARHEAIARFNWSRTVDSYLTLLGFASNA
jgi:glycosyltransferase involved in cell wall biosynthesis